MLTSRANVHRSKLPKIGAIGKLIMGYNRWNEPKYYKDIKSRWVVIGYNVCDSANYRYSHGIHLAYFQSLEYPEMIVELSGFYFEEDEKPRTQKRR